MQITAPDNKMSIGDVRNIKFRTWFKTFQEKVFFVPRFPKEICTRENNIKYRGLF